MLLEFSQIFCQNSSSLVFFILKAAVERAVFRSGSPLSDILNRIIHKLHYLRPVTAFSLILAPALRRASEVFGLFIFRFTCCMNIGPNNAAQILRPVCIRENL
jgi:hypothetical protein